MLRGGGVCIEGPAGSIPKVSPRIRALQDRLLDSLPADGAWECLSPAQREAIISLHRARLTRSIINHSDFNDGVKRQNNNRKSNNNNNNKGQNKGIPRYCRSRSYEDKLESETDDSGVRLASGGGTNSSSTSNSHNSHEDDSSDPGVKKGGRFAKSPSASRFVRKEQKSSFVDFNKQKGVTNGVGNANKIIAKQFHKSGQQCSSNVALDYRNTSGDNTRTRIGCSVLGLENRQHQFDMRYRPYSGERIVGKKEGISRKNILQRYQDSAPLITKESTSSEEYDSGVHFQVDNKYEKEFIEPAKSRRPTSGIDYDFEFESDQTPRSDSTPSPCFQNRKGMLQNADDSKGASRGLIADSLWKPNAAPIKRVAHSLPNKISIEKEAAKENLISYKAQISSKYDYRTHINHEGVNKYSENWNSIVLSKVFPFKAYNNNNFCSSSLQNSLCKTSASPHGRSVGNLVYDARQMRNNMNPNTDSNIIQDRSQGRKYIRSKSLDRKYLEDTTDDEDSDFEIRRRTDRVRRYAKVYQEWDDQSKPVSSKMSPFLRPTYPPKEVTKHKSKSSWDISDKVNHTDSNLEENSNFRSRSTILNRWKSEENELSKNCGQIDREENRRDFDRYKWRRRSCDLELEFSDNNEGGRNRTTTDPLGDLCHKQWQRRSCDFEIDFDEDEEEEEDDTGRKKLYINDWDNSVDNEMKIIQKRTQTSPKDELGKMYPIAPPREKKPVRKCFTQESINSIDEQMVSRDNIIIEQPKRYQIRPEITGRKWSRIEDEHRIVPSSYLVGNKQGKVKSPAFRNKLRLFKSILPF